MASFAVTSSSSTLALGPAQPGGAFDLRVVNQSGFTLTARVQVESQQNPPFLKAELVATDGSALDSASPTIELKANAWSAYRLRVTADPKLAPGTYTFLVKAINTADTDSDIGLSETLSVTIPEVRKPPLPSWLAFAIVGALLVIGGTVAAILALRTGSFKMPPLETLTYDEANKVVQDHLMTILDTKTLEGDADKVDKVVDQKPKADEQVEPGDQVIVTLGIPRPPPQVVQVKVPRILNLAFSEAQSNLIKAGLVPTRLGGTRRTAADVKSITRTTREVVTGADKKEGELVNAGSRVVLTVKLVPIGNPMTEIEIQEKVRSIQEFQSLRTVGGAH